MFGFPVARLPPGPMDDATLGEMLAAARQTRTRLLYWAIPQPAPDQSRRLAALGGTVVDHKVTYVADLVRFRDGIPPPDHPVTPYDATVPDEALIALTLADGHLSRFRQDPRLLPDAFAKLYREWITNAVRGTVADVVLVDQDAGAITAMVTVATQGERAPIGLIAVAPGWRGRGLGTSLVRAAQHWAKERDCRYAAVATQRNNAAACALYERCGYEVGSVEAIYHFWL